MRTYKAMFEYYITRINRKPSCILVYNEKPMKKKYFAKNIYASLLQRQTERCSFLIAVEYKTWLCFRKEPTTCDQKVHR